MVCKLCGMGGGRKCETAMDPQTRKRQLVIGWRQAAIPYLDSAARPHPLGFSVPLIVISAPLSFVDSDRVTVLQRHGLA
jgi:hypothetical protein